MDQAQGKLAAANRICEAIQEFVENDERDQVHVFESSVGNLRAIVGTRKFAGVGPVERQEIIWRYLNDRLDNEDRQRLFGVHALDGAEYAAYEWRRRSDAIASGTPVGGGASVSGSIDSFVRGGAGKNGPEVHDE